MELQNRYIKKILSGVFCLMVALNAQVVKGQEYTDSIVIDTIVASWSDNVIEKLTLLAQEADRSYYSTGISVYDLTGDSLVFAYNQQKMMRPASTQKVLTAISALDVLGAAHNYRTAVYADGKIAPDEKGMQTLNGDIYVIGDFDPKLTVTHLKEIVKAVKATGIGRINGKLYADLSMKDTLCLGNGWCWDDEQPYLTPLSLGGDAYECKPTKINRYNPALNFLQTLSRQLEAERISVNGIGIATYRPTSNSMLICTIVHTVEDIMQQMMKDSDNLYAESMFFQLAADRKKGIGWKDCAAVVESVIEKTGFPTAYVKVADGCGLSLYDYVTASLHVALLRYAYQHEEIFTPLYKTLPIAGVDGTLEKRMTSGAARNNVRAKTGTVTGVSALTGYVTASNGHLLAFSIINNGNRTAAEGRAFQDRVCEVLAE
ncbi:MAG: D-alanyl-D-alanine carboxypeptidase/D-alanyl-D-alanine-endopeptidase [Bacteroidaceae bacterium]|nr:D-alanyl-D-alanine carboxypeptidase/D-alanyl-D-alanine-endopeptidase [Bacteroidaceae bacterium]